MLPSTPITLALAALLAGIAPSGPHAAATQPASTMDDPTIVAIFDAANTWDMETAGVALQKSHSPKVRAFARMMARDHKAARQQGRDLAKRLHVTPTPPGADFALAKDHAAAMKTLRTARGAAFDRAYVDHEVQYHQAVIQAVTSQLLPATKNADLKALETKVAPNFQAHLAAAQQLQQQLGTK